MVVKNTFVSQGLNFAVRMLLKGTVKHMALNSVIMALNSAIKALKHLQFSKYCTFPQMDITSCR